MRRESAWAAGRSFLWGRRRGKNRSRHSTDTVPDRAPSARHRDCRARDGVDVFAELERIADIFAFELRGKRRGFNRKITIRLMVLADIEPRHLAVDVQPDENRDWSAISALERQDLRGPQT